MKILNKFFFSIIYVYLFVQSLHIIVELILKVDSFSKGVSTLFIVLLWGFLLYMGGIFIKSIIKIK
jgi:hypothetical protein